MLFLNLNAIEFSALLGAIGGFIALLYLLDRSRQIRIVPTLRFWNGAIAGAARRRRSVDQPWSLLLQLLSLVLLLLALADVHIGRGFRPKSHVMLLDTSSASALRVRGKALLEEEKQLAVKYLSRVGQGDRVMLVRVDELAHPVTPFTSDLDQVSNAVKASVSSLSALNVQHAFELASQVRLTVETDPGEIVYIGPHRGQSPERSFHVPLNTRLISVGAGAVDNVGIRSVRLWQLPGEHAWRAMVAVENYGPRRRGVRVDAQAASIAFPSRLLSIDTDHTGIAEYDFVASHRSDFHVRIPHEDEFPEDDEASVPVIPQHHRIAVFTGRPEVIGPALRAGSGLPVDCFPPSAYAGQPVAVDLVVLDGFVPTPRPSVPSLWIDPPASESPVPVLATSMHRAIESWSADRALSFGLTRRDTVLPSANVFESLPSDTAVALTRQGPVAIARERDGEVPVVVFGFDPLGETLRFDPSIALLLRNVLRWMIPDALKNTESLAAKVGLHEMPIDPSSKPEQVTVTNASGSAVPFSLRDGKLQFFSPRPSSIMVRTAHSAAIVTAMLPEFSADTWDLNAHVLRGLPQWRTARNTSVWRWLAAAAGLILAFEWSRYGRRTRVQIAMKICGLAVIIIALLAPDLSIREMRQAVVAAVDVSDSIGPAGREMENSRMAEIAAHRGRNWLRVVPFARELGAASTDATDIERALGNAIAMLPARYVPRVLLLSDGNENQGSAARATQELKEAGIPVDTVPVGSATRNRLRIRSVSVPERVYAGESVPVNLVLDAPVDTRMRVAVSVAGKALGSDDVAAHAGSVPVRVRARITSAGAAVLSIRVTAPGVSPISVQRAITVAQPRVLYLSDDPPGTESNFLDALRKAEFDVTRDSTLLSNGLDAVQLVILNNVDPHQFGNREAQALADFVEHGGGLMLLGGEREMYRGDEEPGPVERVLPARLLPPETPEGICVALVIDKSSSMEGRKIELARASAAGVVEHLRPKDTIGVLIFDNSHEWAVPLRRASDKEPIKRLIAGITPDGGTQIPPALSEAYRRVLHTKANFKHILLLTDGISEEGDSVELAKEALLHQVTISTVGLGQDVNKSYLQKIAAASGGNSYFLNDPQGLQQIVLKDVEQYTGRTAIEKPLTPIVDHVSEVLTGVEMQSAPALKGYVRFAAKRGADTILSIDPQKKEALFVRWQYGLGRAAVFASDAKSRWADDWISWPGFDRFWINVARDLVSRGSDTDGEAHFDEDGGTLRLRYRSDREREPMVYVFGPAAFEKAIRTEQTSHGVFEAELHVPNRSGLWVVKPRPGYDAFPEIGVMRYERESRDAGVNEFLLREIASFTGGRFDPAPSQVFQSDGRFTYAKWNLWPAILFLAIGLSVMELVARKKRGLFKPSRVSGQLDLTRRHSGATPAQLKL